MHYLIKTTIPAFAALTITAVGLSSFGFEGKSREDVFQMRESGTAAGNTLTVQAKIEADARRENATEPHQFNTDIEVEVFQNGSPVSDATVRISAYEGPTVTLKYDDDGEYEGEINGYHRAYRLDIIAGENRLEGIYLAGPSIHHFTAPTPDSNVPGGQDLVVRWETGGDEADETFIEGEEFDRRPVEDTGSYTVPANLLDDDDEELELIRRNRLQLPDAGPNSYLLIEVKNEIEFDIKKT